MARGRPRTLPTALPRLAPEVALDPDLEHINIQSRQAIVEEERSRKRRQKQQQVAEQHARQRSRRQIEELTMAYEHAQLTAEKNKQQMERLSQKNAEQLRALDQIRLAVEGGEHEPTPREERQLRNLAGFGKKKPRLATADHEQQGKVRRIVRERLAYMGEVKRRRPGASGTGRATCRSLCAHSTTSTRLDRSSNTMPTGSMRSTDPVTFSSPQRRTRVCFE
ncbi:hypothetical protein PHYPSEUDO_010689 [Phytophthora pseudosyringae]|uniref:Uncharacterized protein n=1 Tax=Phytophthora pseudosyringae TaxID=221518 RepID=A0A8T1VAG2_9STRA|nr:hypothetical protein PHYPSEUDO_010689 [Phytophthora pseudosyringae]